MDREAYIESRIEWYEFRNGTLSAHNKSTLRQMYAKEFDRETRFFDTEEGRVLKDSNRYPEG